MTRHLGRHRHYIGDTKAVRCNNSGQRIALEAPAGRPLPSYSQLQQEFAVLVERVECLRVLQREALRQAEHLFASLLHHAFSSEL